MILSVIIVSCMLGVYNLLNSLEQQAFAQRNHGPQFRDHREVRYGALINKMNNKIGPIGISLPRLHQMLGYFINSTAG